MQVRANSMNYIRNKQKVFQNSYQNVSESPRTSPIALPIVSKTNNEKFDKKEKKIIINEIFHNADIKPSNRRYSRVTKVFAMGLMLISLTAFSYVRSKIPLPSRQILNNFF